MRKLDGLETLDKQIERLAEAILAKIDTKRPSAAAVLDTKHAYMCEVPSSATHRERLLRAREVYADRLHISRSSFYDLIRSGNFPPGVLIGRQGVRWPEQVVNDFINTLPPVSRPIERTA